MAKTAVSTRQRALKAALTLFDSQGINATTIEEVRERSGVSIGSLYHHFGSRAGLLATLYQDLLDRYRAVLMAELARCQDARAILETVIVTHITWAVTNTAATRFLMEYRHHPEVSAAEDDLQEGTADFLRPLLARIKPAVAAGEIRDLPPELLSSLVIGPAQNWLKLWFAGRTGLEPQIAARQLTELAWAAIAAPHGRDDRMKKSTP